jgi:hypothetical protein
MQRMITHNGENNYSQWRDRDDMWMSRK